MPRVLVVGDRRKPGVPEGVEKALPLLRSRLRVVDVDLDDRVDLSKAVADLLIVFGGDGSLLHVAGRLGRNAVPVLGVNYGRFGYLADLQPEELETGVDALAAGRYEVSDRSRLACTLRSPSGPTKESLALNDVVVGRTTLGRMVDLDVRIDGREAVAVAGDGLIVATPSGSTAHALSAGGPIVEPSVSALVLVPVCPHALGTRPLLVPQTSRVELRLRAGSSAAVVTTDGRRPEELHPDAVVGVEDAHSPLRLVSVSGRSYYDSLRVKFGWAGRPNYRDGPGGPNPPGAPRAP
jgi:NAD+ kinase